ncbi:hypothetical protein [Methylobacterium frigidaeris]|uniref:hypothetical protein n=1 Tax=Methylobacterium frigidaeris TaxID=2038277 RepID=UPI001056189C|nr:hypothetical protein [Methylobacterium frigidaeris]
MRGLVVAGVAEPSRLGYVWPMSDVGQARGRRMARWRAVAAVLSLYGLVLQAFLTGLGPVPVAAGPGLVCQSHQAPAGGEPLVHAHACCTVACQAPLAPPAPATAEAWPPRAAVVLSWSIEAAAPARAAPARPASARGPPAA